MTDEVLVSPTEESPTHHLSLTDGTTTLGFILCDSSGNPTNLPLRETPVPPTVTRISNSDSGYADFEQPYSVTVQEDWSGGRGQEDFEDNKTRFLDSYWINTTGGDIVCGPGMEMEMLQGSGKPIFFEYYGSFFVMISPMDGSAPKLYMNGLRGQALSNTGALTKLKTSLNISASATPKIAVIIEGPGREEDQNWRRVVSNTAGPNTEFTVDSAWLREHTTADGNTKFVIYGELMGWTEVAGHGCTKTVTDICVVDDFFYMAQGDYATIRRGRIKTDESGWEWGDEGNNKATFLEMIADKTGKRQIWKAHLTDVEVADAVAWPTQLTFGTSIPCGNKRSRITHLIPYGEPQKPYIIKEDSFGSVADSVWAQIPLGEMASVRSILNGRAATQNDVYLYFSLRDGLERYYNGKLDDIGPNKDTGLPAGRKGPIVKIISHPTGLFCAIDGGPQGYSSILHWNKVGWHELYRSAADQQILDMIIQAMPGAYYDDGATPSYSDLLWFYEHNPSGGTIRRIPISPNPRLQHDYKFSTGAGNYRGRVESSYIYTTLAEVVKYWSAIKVFGENLVAGHQEITVEYRVDNATAWTSAGTITTSPSQELALGSHNVTGRRLQYRLTLSTDDATKTPRVRRVLIEAVQRIPPKRTWSISFFVADDGLNLNGEELEMKAKAYADQLRTWADSRSTAAPLVLHHNLDLWDDIYVFVEPASIQPIIPTKIVPDRVVRLVGQMMLREA